MRNVVEGVFDTPSPFPEAPGDFLVRGIAFRFRTERVLRPMPTFDKPPAFFLMREFARRFDFRSASMLDS